MSYKMPPLDALAENTGVDIADLSWRIKRATSNSLEVKIVHSVPGYGPPSTRKTALRTVAYTTVEFRGPQPVTPDDIAGAIEDAAWALMMRHAPKLLPPLELPEIEGAVFGDEITTAGSGAA